jgi:hypothetical protein
VLALYAHIDWSWPPRTAGADELESLQRGGVDSAALGALLVGVLPFRKRLPVHPSAACIHLPTKSASWSLSPRDAAIRARRTHDVGVCASQEKARTKPPPMVSRAERVEVDSFDFKSRVKTGWPVEQSPCGALACRAHRLGCSQGKCGAAHKGWLSGAQAEAARWECRAWDARLIPAALC